MIGYRYYIHAIFASLNNLTHTCDDFQIEKNTAFRSNNCRSIFAHALIEKTEA